MKRSDAEEIIKDILLDTIGARLTAMSKRILNELEQSGMLPPTRDVIIEGHVCDENSWEPENGVRNKLMPSELSPEEIKELIENDEDLK